MVDTIVEVTGYNSEGDGVARLVDGRVVFIRGSARGDLLEVRLTEEKPRITRAEITRILNPSPYRIKSDCPFYPECGGCNFRYITYEEELGAKLQRVNDALERIGGLPLRLDSILNTGQTAGYRNKAVLHTNGKSTGFYHAGSREIIPVDHCLLLKDDLNEALKSLRRNREVTLRSGRNGLEKPLEEELDGLIFRISGFFQVNTGAALLLFNKAREYAALTKDDTLLDLYCGVGALTLFIGRDAGNAVGVERDPDAIVTARENAHRNKLPHIEFISADVDSAWNVNCREPDCITVDPPRRGLSDGALQKIKVLNPKRLVYISCDPATMARDIKRLDGYTVSEICAIDMFPRTANVECCCLLSRINS